MPTYKLEKLTELALQLYKDVELIAKKKSDYNAVDSAVPRYNALLERAKELMPDDDLLVILPMAEPAMLVDELLILVGQLKAHVS